MKDMKVVYEIELEAETPRKAAETAWKWLRDPASIPPTFIVDGKAVDLSEPEHEPAPPGMYLRLFHGRVTPDEELEDWGKDGPFIGPIKWYHTTYHNHIRFATEQEPDGITLTLVDDLLYYKGMYYGDWSVFYHDGTGFPEGMTAPLSDPRQEDFEPPVDRLTKATELIERLLNVGDDMHELGKVQAEASRFLAQK